MTLQELHESLGHRNVSDLLGMIKNNSVNGIDLTNKTDFHCELCYQAKSNKKSLPKNASPKDYPPGEFLQMDLSFCDIPSAHGSNHTVVVTDYTSRMVYVSNQTVKSQTAFLVLKMIHSLENQTGVTVKLIQNDKGREF